MRRMTWCCVVGGLLGICAGVGWSQDLSPFARRIPSEFAPTSAGKAPRKSYYAELFGANDAAPEARAVAESPAQSKTTAPPAPGDTVAFKTPPAHGGSLNIARRPPAAEPSINDGVIYAEFERSSADNEAADVLQVGGQRIVRPSRQTRVERSALTEPIAIPAQAADESVEPLFEQAPPPPRDDEPARAVAVPLPARSHRARPTTPPVEVAAPVAQAPNIQVTWNKQGEVSIGRECRCQLVLKNAGAAAAQNLEVVALFSDNVRLLNSDPPPARSEGSLVWDIAELAAGESQTIQITMLPLRAGEINTQAEVRFSTAVSGSFQIAEPKLGIKLNGTSQTLLGESATQTILITNPGTGVAGNVKIVAVIPPGLEHARGGELLMDIGALHPGETRSVRLPLAAVRGGKHVVQVEARADGGLVQQASCAVSVIAPQMKAAMDGPALRYLGRRATYTVRVTNDGEVPSENVRVMHKVPAGFEFINADNGGQFDSSTDLLNWFVGRLEPGQTLALGATFECNQIGEFTHFVRSTNDQGAVSDSQVTTAVQGTPLLSMSVRDLDDPVETGAETAYEVEVKNEGSAAAERVQLTCELPETMTLINVTGKLAHRQAAGVIAFAPLEQLRPGESATVRIHVRSTESGNLRFRAQLASDSVDEPLIEEEVTKFYGE